MVKTDNKTNVNIKIEKMTEEGLNLLYNDLGKIEKELDDIYKEFKKPGKDDFEIETLIEKKVRLEFRKNSLLQRIARVEIIEAKIMDNLHINIGDVVDLLMIFDEDDQEKITLELVGGEGKTTENKVSINSPVGKAIYGHEVGETVSYKVNKTNEARVKILRKVNKNN